VLANGFLSLEDDRFVYANARVVAPLSAASVARIFQPRVGEIYAPLSTLSYHLEYNLFGLNPAPYHATNLLLHAVNALLSFFLFRAWGAGRLAAFVAALVFALHPMKVHSVAWVTERRDVLCGFFFLAALLAYGKYLTTGRGKPYAVHLACFLLALLAKPVAVVMPAVLLLWDVKAGRPLVPKAWAEKAPHLFLSTILSAITLVVLKPVVFVHELGLLAKSLMAVKTVVFYLEKFLFPLHLSATYFYLSPIKMSSPDFYRPACLFLLLNLIVIFAGRKNREVLFGWFFFLVLLAPTLPMTATDNLYGFVSDHYLYLPSLGLIHATAAAALGVFASAPGSHAFRSSLAGTLGVVLVFSLGRLTHERTHVWRNDLAFFSDMIAKCPACYMAFNNLGVVHQRRERWKEAEMAYRRALELKPDYPKARYNLAVVLGEQGRYAEALAEYERVLAQAPEKVHAHYGKGLLQYRLGRFKEARVDFERARALEPGHAPAHYGLGLIAIQEGHVAEAIAHYREAIRHSPDWTDARAALEHALSLDRKGQARETEIRHG
jgi:tetratricopeptide (TPR) repeat protein